MFHFWSDKHAFPGLKIIKACSLTIARFLCNQILSYKDIYMSGVTTTTSRGEIKYTSRWTTHPWENEITSVSSSFKIHINSTVRSYFYSFSIPLSFKKTDRYQEILTLEQRTLIIPCFSYSFITFAMTSGSGSSIGSAHSTVTTFPQTFTLPLINLRLAWAAVLWSSYSRKQKPRFFFLSSGWWYNMTSVRPSEIKQKIHLL